MSNNYQGQGSGMHFQSIFTYSSEQKHELGYRLELADGRVFRYASTAVDQLACNIVQQASVSTYALHRGCTGVATIVGDKKVSFTAGATAGAANMYKDGMLIASNDTASITRVANSYKISGNTAITTAGSYAVTVYLADPIVVATSTSFKFHLHQNPYSLVIVPPKTTLTGSIMGLNPIAVPAATDSKTYYYWLQTWGLAAAERGVVAAIGPGTALIPYVTSITKGITAGATGSIQPIGVIKTTTSITAVNAQIIGHSLDSAVAMASFGLAGATNRRYISCFLKIAR
jgi:hypothetical protein